MLNLEDDLFEDQLASGFKAFEKNVQLGTFKTYIKREAIPKAKKDIEYWEKHYESEKTRFRGVTMEEEWHEDENGNYHKEIKPRYHGAITWKDGKIVNYEQMTENEHNFCIEKIHLAERYLCYLEEVLQGSIKVNLERGDHPLIQDEKKYNEIIQKFRDRKMIQGKIWKGQKQEFWALAYLLIGLEAVKNLPGKKLYKEFSKQLEDIGDESNLRRIFKKMENRYLGKIEDKTMIDLLSKMEKIAEQELQKE